MTPEEIKIAIDANLATVQRLVEAGSGQFVLNERVLELLNENTKLAQMCEHEFKNGFCIYCSTKQK